MARSHKSAFLGIFLVSSMLGLGCLPGADERTSTAQKSPPTPPADVQPSPSPAQPASPAKEIDPLRQRIEAALTSVHSRDLLTTNSFWTVFHGILGMGPKTTLKDPETGKRYNAVDYVFSEAGATIRGLQFMPTDAGVDVLTAGANPFSKEHEAQ